MSAVMFFICIQLHFQIYIYGTEMPSVQDTPDTNLGQSGAEITNGEALPGPAVADGRRKTSKKFQIQSVDASEDPLYNRGAQIGTSGQPDDAGPHSTRIMSAGLAQSSEDSNRVGFQSIRVLAIIS